MVLNDFISIYIVAISLKRAYKCIEKHANTKNLKMNHIIVNNLAQSCLSIWNYFTLSEMNILEKKYLRNGKVEIFESSVKTF